MWDTPPVVVEDVYSSPKRRYTGKHRHKEHAEKLRSIKGSTHATAAPIPYVESATHGPMDLMPVRFYGGFRDLTEGGQIHVFLGKNQRIGNSSS